MKVRLVARVVTYDRKTKRILLVKNRGAVFWYPPGGGWEYEHEHIRECAKREVFEETGLDVTIQRLLYVQEFQESSDTIFFETFWFAELAHEQTLNPSHIDHDLWGSVEQIRWFSQGDLANVTVFPKRLKDTFWDTIDDLVKTEDPFIGSK